MDAGPAIERLKDYAARIGVLLKLEPYGSSYRILIDSSADLVLEEMLIGYIEEEMGLQIMDDPIRWTKPWRPVGLIVIEE